MSMDSRSELILKLLQKMEREGAARYMEGVPALRSLKMSSRDAVLLRSILY